MSSTRRLDYRPAAPELPEHPLRLIPLYSWLGLLVSLVALIAAIVWGFTGALTISVERAGTLTLADQKPEAVTYVAAEQAQAVRPGLPARVVVRSTGEEFEGEVTRVALSPTTPEQAAAVAGADVLGGGPIFEIRVTLHSSIFSEGSPCHISIVTGEERPISRVLPIFS